MTIILAAIGICLGIWLAAMSFAVLCVIGAVLKVSWNALLGKHENPYTSQKS